MTTADLFTDVSQLLFMILRHLQHQPSAVVVSLFPVVDDQLTAANSC